LVYKVEIEYTRFNGIMPKIMAFLMPGVFKKQTQKWLDQFKMFTENEGRKQEKFMTGMALHEIKSVKGSGQWAMNS